MVEQQTHRLERAVARAVARREIRRVDSAATALAIFDLTRGLLVRRLSLGCRFGRDRETRYSSPISSGGGSDADPASPAAAPIVRHPGGAAATGSKGKK